MRKLTLFSLVLVSAALFTGTAFADLTGATVNWQYYAYGGPYTSNFGGGTSSGTFAIPCTSCGDFDGYFLIHADATSITFDYSVCATTGECPNFWSDSVLSKAPNLYNGIDLIFSVPITSVSIDAATNMSGFNSSFLYFSGNELQVDWHNLPFDSSTIVKLDINSSTTVPEPGTLAMLGTGLLAAAGIVRRKIV